VLTVTFMGLYGPASPLPAPYTEAVIAADVDDPTRRDFLDFFHQRPLGFLYRGWRKYRYYVNFAPGAEDDFSQRVFAFFGAHFRGLRSVVHLDWVRLLSCGGLLAQAGASAEVVGRVVSHYFGGLAAAVEPFVRCRFAIAEDQLARIGRVNSTLGRDLFVGRSAADLSGRFRLRLGPLDWRRLNDFLPVGADHRPLVELVRFALADPLDFELALMIRREDVRPLTLDRTGDCRLGWTSWIGRPDDALQCVRLQVQ
jgi:type VI secretion system protein ImpH